MLGIDVVGVMIPFVPSVGIVARVGSKVDNAIGLYKFTNKLDNASDIVRLRKDFPWHHIFPQEKELAEIFKYSGIDINEHLVSLPQDIHKAIHKGAGGGLWNQAWKDFFADYPEAIGNAELIYKQAGWIIHEFGLNDVIVLIVK